MQSICYCNSRNRNDGVAIHQCFTNPASAKKAHRTFQDRQSLCRWCRPFCCRRISHHTYSARAMDQCVFLSLRTGVQDVEHGLHVEGVQLAVEHLQRRRRIVRSARASHNNIISDPSGDLHSRQRALSSVKAKMQSAESWHCDNKAQKVSRSAGRSLRLLE
jgi:hypothetical protein